MQSENSNTIRTTLTPPRGCAAADLSGIKIETWTITSNYESRINSKSKKRRGWWLCKCDCGILKWIMSQSLLKQEVPICECTRYLKRKRRRDALVGKVFGSITVVADHSDEPKGRGGRVLCRCACGTEKVITIDLFGQNFVNSCGCKSGILPPGHAARNIILARYKKNALIRSKEWSLSDEEALRMMDLNCHYCGSPPANVQGNGSYGRWNGEWSYNGIDRKNNDLGYLPENVVPACASCNRAKNTMPYTSFMAWIERLVRYRTGMSSRRTSAEHKHNLQLALPQ